MICGVEGTTCDDLRSLLQPGGVLNFPAGPEQSPGRGQGPGASEDLAVNCIKNVPKKSPSWCILFHCFQVNLRHFRACRKQACHETDN